MPIDVAGTLGDLVTEDSRRMRVLEQLGLDYCCNGHRTLAEASTSAGLDPAVVAESLVFAEPPAVAERGPRENTDLAHEIVDTHHAYMWEEMPRLKALVDKVEGVHGTAHPELAQVKAAFDEALGALEPHMTKEERQIFPAISRMERTGSASDPLDAAVAELVDEHQHVGNLFKRLRTLTNGFEVPRAAAGRTGRCSPRWTRWSATCTSTSTRRTTCSSPEPWSCRSGSASADPQPSGPPSAPGSAERHQIHHATLIFVPKGTLITATR